MIFPANYKKLHGAAFLAASSRISPLDFCLMTNVDLQPVLKEDDSP